MARKTTRRPNRAICDVCERTVRRLIEGRHGKHLVRACESCWSNAPTETRKIRRIK
jgi:hypothetical protein